MRNLESPWNRANVIRKPIGVTAFCIEHFSTFHSKYMSDDTDSGVVVTCADAALPTSAILNHATPPALRAVRLSALTHIVLLSLQYLPENCDNMIYLGKDDSKQLRSLSEKYLYIAKNIVFFPFSSR